MSKPDFEFSNGVVLASASFYTKKYYLNPLFDRLPQKIKQELQITCVLFTEEVGGIIVIYFNDDDDISIITETDENDILYDEIGSGLKIRQIRNEKRTLLEQLEQYYKLVIKANN